MRLFFRARDRGVFLDVARSGQFGEFHRGALADVGDDRVERMLGAANESSAKIWRGLVCE